MAADYTPIDHQSTGPAGSDIDYFRHQSLLRWVLNAQRSW
jgi:hypothetical protein